jgi:23S rRNA pseudouridine1911/1915/1917 synthase
MDPEKTTPPVSTHRFVVGAEDAGKRIDVLLAERVPELSRRRARLLIGAGAVWIGERRVLVQSRPVAAGQEVACHLQSFDFPRSEPLDPLHVLHEDAALVAVDKPSGMPSHPTYARTLGTALQRTEEMLRRRAGKKVPLWPLHRLDAATSGVLVFAKSRAAARAMNQSFARRRVAKRYLALVRGAPVPPEGEIRLALAEGHLRTEAAAHGKEAVTRYRILESRRGFSLLELEPTTGRMHQLRVHLAAIGHPIAGDAKYGGEGEAGAPRLMLHASRLEFPHPIGGAAFAIESPPPEDFRAVLDAMLRRASVQGSSA